MQITPGSVLFAFPSISISPPASPASSATPGFLVLSTESVPTPTGESDIFLRLRFTPDNAALGHPIDTLISARETLAKSSPTTFTLTTDFGDLTIVFPDLETQIPLDDDRIDIPREMRTDMSWGQICSGFETEVDRWVVYRKNEYSLTDGFGLQDGSGKGKMSKAQEAGYGYGGGAYAGESSSGIPPYDPRDYGKGKGSDEGRVVLVDEENGDEVGEVGGAAVHTEGIKPGSKDPVEITMPTTVDGPVTVRPAPQEYLKDALHPAYKDSTIVSTAATVSRLIVTTSSYLASGLNSGADVITTRTAPAAKPMTFHPTTHQRFAQLHTLSSSAAKFSASTIGRVNQIAQNAGARLVGKNDPRPEKGGRAKENPGLLNKGLIAFGTIADGIDYAGKSLLGAGAGAATKVVSHRYGEEAGRAAEKLAGSVRNVGVVYIDAAGVSRRAVVKGVAKGMVVGKVRGGGEVVVPADSMDVKGEKNGQRVESPPAYSPNYFPPPPTGEKGKVASY